MVLDGWLKNTKEVSEWKRRLLKLNSQDISSLPDLKKELGKILVEKIEAYKTMFPYKLKAYSNSESEENVLKKVGIDANCIPTNKLMILEFSQAVVLSPQVSAEIAASPEPKARAFCSGWERVQKSIVPYIKLDNGKVLDLLSKNIFPNNEAIVTNLHDPILSLKNFEVYINKQLPYLDSSLRLDEITEFSCKDFMSVSKADAQDKGKNICESFITDLERKSSISLPELNTLVSSVSDLTKYPLMDVYAENHESFTNWLYDQYTQR